jgi:hypothetical protein
MNEFESWNKLRGIDFRVRFSPPKQFEAYIEQEREDAWEAALKRAKSRIDYANAGNDLIDWIFEEELDATTKERPRSGLRFSS